jgi:Signal peptide peptidase
MLGLGDIVIPGIFVALLLRYDQTHNGGSTRYFYRYLAGCLELQAQRTASQSRLRVQSCPSLWNVACEMLRMRFLAFCSAFGGYVAGLTATIIVMNVFNVRCRWCHNCIQDHVCAI